MGILGVDGTAGLPPFSRAHTCVSRLLCPEILGLLSEKPFSMEVLLPAASESTLLGTSDLCSCSIWLQTCAPAMCPLSVRPVCYDLSLGGNAMLPPGNPRVCRCFRGNLGGAGWVLSRLLFAPPGSRRSSVFFQSALSSVLTDQGKRLWERLLSTFLFISETGSQCSSGWPGTHRDPSARWD